MSAEQDEAAVGSVTAEERAAWREWTHFNNEKTGGGTEIQVFIRRLLADLEAAEERAFNAENTARLAEESEAGWRREADELAERLAAVSALAEEDRRQRAAHKGDCGCSYKDCYECGKWCRCIHTPWTAIRAALTTTPTPAAEVGRREESGR